MEIILVLIAVVLGAVVYYSRKPKDLVEAEQAEAVPYKVETPAPVAEVTAPVVAEEKPAKKPRAPRKTTATAKKPAAKKTTAAKKPKAK
jgi:hypothetical protein